MNTQRMKQIIATALTVVLTASVIAGPSTARADEDRRSDSRLLAQLTQFDGGCPPNECTDEQFSIHRAPVCANGPDTSLDGYSIGMLREFSTDLAAGSSTLVRTDARCGRASTECTVYRLVGRVQSGQRVYPGGRCLHVRCEQPAPGTGQCVLRNRRND